MSYKADLEAIYDRLRQGNLANAADDIASLAAELEDARSEIALCGEQNSWLWDQFNNLQADINAIARPLGHDAERGVVTRALKRIAALVEKCEDQEAAIRAARAMPLSGEAVRVLSECLLRHKV